MGKAINKENGQHSQMGKYKSRRTKNKLLKDFRRSINRKNNEIDLRTAEYLYTYSKRMCTSNTHTFLCQPICSETTQEKMLNKTWGRRFCL